MKYKWKIAVDIAMVVLLPMLMAYSLIGEKFHEIVGTAMFVLFIVHHILNRKWYTALPKGKWSSRRIFQTVLDFLLLIFMILQPVSGILMSKHLYTFLPVLPISAKAREIHMLLAYWGFVLMSVHAGTHLTGPVAKLKRSSKKVWVAVLVIISAISVYGIYAFIKRGFPGYMFMRTAFAFFDYGEPRVYFFMDYLSVMALFVCLGILIVSALSASKKADKKERR